MTRKLALFALALWAVTALGLGLVFVRGNTQPGSDGRTAVLLAPAERDFVLGEMRHVLGAVQAITEALAKGDTAQAARAARAAGGDAVAGVPPSLLAKLPLDFKQAGLAMHAGFDGIADAADKGADKDALTQQLAEQLNLCLGCHQSFRIDPAR